MNADADKILPGSRVCMHFSLALPDGTEAVSTFDEEPLTFTMGDGTLAEELELALYGLRPGADQTLRVDGRKAYGPRDASNIHSLPLDGFPADVQPQPGMIIGFRQPDGDEIPGAVLEIADGMARVDFNHPLAGREVVFRARILAVDPPPANGDE